MTIRVQLPPVLRAVSGGARTLEAEGSTIAAALTDLAAKHAALKLHFFDEAGGIRGNIVFLHAGAMIRAKEASARRLNDGDEVVITNALAGG